MIKPFKLSDLGSFLPNEFSDPDPVLDQLTDASFVVETMWSAGMAAAILCYKNYWEKNWFGFFLIAEQFTPRNALALKSHIHATMIKHDARRLQTDSVACDKLTQWHEWLGFKWEGCREKFIFNKDYDMWALMRGGK